MTNTNTMIRKKTETSPHAVDHRTQKIDEPNTRKDKNQRSLTGLPKSKYQMPHWWYKKQQAQENPNPETIGSPFFSNDMLLYIRTKNTNPLVLIFSSLFASGSRPSSRPPLFSFLTQSRSRTFSLPSLLPLHRSNLSIFLRFTEEIDPITKLAPHPQISFPIKDESMVGDKRGGKEKQTNASAPSQPQSSPSSSPVP